MQDFGVHCLQANRAAHGPSAARDCRAAIPGQQVLFAHLFSQKEKGGSAKWTYTHEHIEESELKPQHKENKNSRDQRGQGAAQEREQGN